MKHVCVCLTGPALTLLQYFARVSDGLCVALWFKGRTFER